MHCIAARSRIAKRGEFVFEKTKCEFSSGVIVWFALGKKARENMCLNKGG